MERGSGFHRNRKHAKEAAAAAPPPPSFNNNNNNSDMQANCIGSSNINGCNSSISPRRNNNININDDVEGRISNLLEGPQHLKLPAASASASPPYINIVREQDQYMPIANVIRIMRRVLPANAKISDDAKETIQECVSEYISFITAEANERCQCEQRKTITTDDVLWAMCKLGFDDYIEPLLVFLNRYRESENEHAAFVREWDHPAIPNRTRSAVHYGLPVNFYGPILPAMGMGDVRPPPIFYPTTVLQGAAAATASGSSSDHDQTALPNFDPFAQFK